MALATHEMQNVVNEFFFQNFLKFEKIALFMSKYGLLNILEIGLWTDHLQILSGLPQPKSNISFQYTTMYNDSDVVWSSKLILA